MTHDSTPTIFPLSAVTRRIQQLLAEASLKSFWIRAEITSGRRKGGSFYCDLTEADNQGQVIARLRCTIWPRDLKRIEERFAARAVELQLADGTAAIFCCQLQYSPQYGLSLKVIDADPAFALGELEQRKREILEGLKKDGLLDLNSQQELPAVPLRIGVVTSANSAACADFIQTLRLSGYRFELQLADAVVQGMAAEQSVLKALERLSVLDCDLVAVIRGGGSKTDLSWLDNDRIARAISAQTCPVWTGIGHEIDTSVLDYVAHQSFKTPTAVAEELMARCVQADRFLDEGRERLKTVWTYRLTREQQWLERADTGLRNGVRKMLDIARSQLREAAMAPWTKVSDRLSRERVILGEKSLLLRQGGRTRIQQEQLRLQQAGKGLHRSSLQTIERADHRLALVKQSFRPGRILQRLDSEKNRLNDKQATLQAHDPGRIVQRGFAIIRDAGNQIITTTTAIERGEEVTVAMRDGQLKTTVNDIEQDKEPS